VTERAWEVVAVLRMGPSNAYYHLKPVATAPNVTRLWS